MKATLTLLVLVVLTSCGVAVAQDLPDDILADQYLLEAKRALERGDAKATLHALGKIEDLDTEPPVEFLYVYGKLLVETGSGADLRKGESLLKQYVVRIERGSEHYEATLTLLSLAEARLAAAAKTPSLSPGTVFRDCDECPQMVVVPAGSYMMGSPSGEAEHFDDEGPVHRVTFDRPFAVGVYEVTFREWDSCVAGGGCNGYRPADAGWSRGDRPVINVSWRDAQAYVRWLSRETGEGYRLLSESEWEYVARAGTTGPFHTGATISTDQANYDGNYVYGSGHRGVYREQTVVVGIFSPNRFGLHDVHGNVWEWVEDCWHSDYAGAPVDGGAWERGGNCSRRVVRGGSWFFIPRNLRAAYRFWYSTGNRSNNLGFRITRTLTP